jgi:hypothetical protein
MKPSKRLVKWTLTLVAVPAAIFGSIAYLAARNRPNITHNYAAELNAPILAVPEDQQAWPIYRESLHELALNEPSPWLAANFDDFERVLHVKEVIDYLDRQEPTLRRVRAAAKLTSLGYRLADQSTSEDLLLQRRRSTPGAGLGPLPPVEAPSENPCVFYLILNATDYSQELAKALAAHALVSAKRGDTASAVDDISAMIGIARQIRETPFMLNDLVSLRRSFSLALSTWGRCLETVPDKFTAEQLLRLERESQAYGDGKPLIRTAVERMMFADTVQRFFSDDGRGDGHGCYDRIVDIGTERTLEDRIKSLFAPKSPSASWPRRRNVEAGERYLNLLQAELERPLWECDCDGLGVEYDRLRNDPQLGFAQEMLGGLLTVHRDQQDAMQKRDALLTASAIVRYRLDHKSWPERLDALVPSHLTTIPPDQFTGRPLGYRLVDGTPRIYSVGFDKQDDGGVAAEITIDSGERPEKQPWHWSFGSVAKETKGDQILWPVGPKVIPLDPAPTVDESNK